MTLLQALEQWVKSHGRIDHAKLIVFAVSDIDERIAYVAEMPLEELVSTVEKWCKDRRADLSSTETGSVH